MTMPRSKAEDRRLFARLFDNPARLQERLIVAIALARRQNRSAENKRRVPDSEKRK